MNPVIVGHVSPVIVRKIFDIREKIGALPKDGFNPHFRSRYTKFDTILDRLNPLLKEERLLMTRDEKIVEGVPSVVIAFYHVDGDKDAHMAWTLPTQVIPGTFQNVGAAFTYLGRILLLGILGIQQEEEDDDGNRASGISTTRATSTTTVQGESKPQALISGDPANLI